MTCHSCVMPSRHCFHSVFHLRYREQVDNPVFSWSFTTLVTSSQVVVVSAIKRIYHEDPVVGGGVFAEDVSAEGVNSLFPELSSSRFGPMASPRSAMFASWPVSGVPPANSYASFLISSIAS